MALIDSITLGNLNIIEVDADPTVSGVTANIGDIAIKYGIPTGMWQKNGALDTNWDKVSFNSSPPYNHPNHSGDVTSVGDGAQTISNGVVTNAKLANVVTQTIKGRNAAGTGVPSDLTVTQVTAMLNNFTSSLKGLTPPSGGGTVNFLRADGTWAAPISAPVYGSNYQWTESTSQSSTSSQTFQLKLRLTTASLPAGNYRIGWYYNWSHSSNSSNFEAQIVLNSSILVEDHKQEPKDRGLDQEHPVYGFGVRALSGVSTIDIVFRSDDSSDTAYIRNSRLEIWRVS